MDAAKLKKENQRLKEMYAQSQKELQEANAQHAATVEQFALSIEEKDRQVAALQHRIKQLLLKIRGSRQERIDPDQLLLFSFEELQELANELEDAAKDEPEADDTTKPSSSRKGGRKKLPKNLFRETKRYELEGEELRCPCCGEERHEIGVESSEQLEYIPARWKVIQHDRVKYACKACEENVAIASKPPQPIEKGLPGPGLCAHTVLSKFGDHTPLYRQEDIHSRTGYCVRRSTLCGWLGSLATLSQPLVMRMKELLLQSKVIHTDDTKIKMIVAGNSIAQEAKFWPYLGDWLHRYAVYDFTIDRTRQGPKHFLADYEGHLQADAYSGYDCIYASDTVFEVACWLHARRYWHQALDNDEVRANTALGYIARLSQIETQLRESFPSQNLQGLRDFDAVKEARQQHARPILEEFRGWMDRELDSGKILPKSVLRSAFTYTLNQWDALCRYTDHGYLSMDNNAAERLVKNPAIGRKNYLFVIGIGGGTNAATFYSLVSSAKANGVEPFSWLRDVFTRLPYHRDGKAFAQCAAGDRVTSDELDYLLPDHWLESHPDQVWTIDEVRRFERKRSEKRRRLKRRRRR